MVRPTEDLGEPFSFRLPLALDRLARRQRTASSMPLAAIVRSWLVQHFAAQAPPEPGAPRPRNWEKRYNVLKKRLKNLKRLHRLELEKVAAETQRRHSGGFAAPPMTDEARFEEQLGELANG